MNINQINNQINNQNKDKINEVIKPKANLQEIKEVIQDYFEDNNKVQSFLLENFNITKDKKDRVKCSEFNERFNRRNGEKLSPQKINKDMLFNGFNIYRSNGIKYYVGIKFKSVNDLTDNSLN